jgi:type I restriction enzyme S subunit
MVDSELGEIPKGWNTESFSELININPLRKLSKGKIAKKIGMTDLVPWQSWIETYEMEPYSSGPKFQNGDVLFARITPSLEHGKTALVSFLDLGEVAFGSTEFIIFAPKIIRSSYYIYFLAIIETIRETAIKAMTGSSGRQRVPNDCFDHITICSPPENLLMKFHNTISPLFERININVKESKNLKQIRDLLLPKLMSGEIRVPVSEDENS